MAYSEDFRKRALDYMDEGHTYEELYEAFKIYPTAIEDWRKLLAETSSLKPRYRKTRKRKIDKDKLAAAVKEKPDAFYTLKIEEYKTTFRPLEVTYIYGKTETGKTRSVMERFGYENVYRVTDYKHPFDSYQHQDVILFDEFLSQFRIQDMLNYLDGYPLDLPCRYSNKQACYTKVFIISNLDLLTHYEVIQRNSPDIWTAFLRRIHKVVTFVDVSVSIEYSLEEYLETYWKLNTKKDMEELNYEVH